ncbi:hypothetical protein GCM10018790_64390 [Kitasatospora xanthocidica]|uniref:hypothetical protein n=1 Tax=Kitasatospora xanthocidica TaxID=83382 RepID=UPI001678F293|nr:hypothetical protein [Kitasatospora xanthocidica]GHF77402.1 hypothetical protein GCM10018790_64390 [Kitasatospora xanthocidica]
MRLTKRLATTGAALGLATAGLVGLGSTSAHAADNCQELDSYYGARINMCIYRVNLWDVTMHYNVIRRGSTDERVWFTSYTPGCGSGTYTDVSGNDYSEPSKYFEVVCAGQVGGITGWISESGRNNSVGGVGVTW